MESADCSAISWKQRLVRFGTVNSALRLIGVATRFEVHNFLDDVDETRRQFGRIGELERQCFLQMLKLAVVVKI
jgi:hypothetical protein